MALPPARLAWFHGPQQLWLGAAIHCRDTDTGAYRKRDWQAPLAFDFDALDVGTDVFHRRQGAAFVGVGHDHHEVIASEPTNKVGLRGRLLDGVRGHAQDGIAAVCSQGVVQQAEVVQVHQGDRERGAGAQHGVERLVHLAEVRHARERIDEQAGIGLIQARQHGASVFHALDEVP